MICLYELQTNGYHEVLDLYCDLCRKWLRPVARVAVLSILKEPTVDLLPADKKFNFDFSGVFRKLKNLMSKRRGDAGAAEDDADQEEEKALKDPQARLMKIKVRVHSILVNLMEAVQPHADDTQLASELDGADYVTGDSAPDGTAATVPVPLLTFVPQYLITNGTFFPESFNVPANLFDNPRVPMSQLSRYQRYLLPSELVRVVWLCPPLRQHPNVYCLICNFSRGDCDSIDLEH